MTSRSISAVPAFLSVLPMSNATSGSDAFVIDFSVVSVEQGLAILRTEAMHCAKESGFERHLESNTSLVQRFSEVEQATRSGSNCERAVAMDHVLASSSRAHL